MLSRFQRFRLCRAWTQTTWRFKNAPAVIGSELILGKVVVEKLNLNEKLGLAATNAGGDKSPLKIFQDAANSSSSGSKFRPAKSGAT